MTKEGGTEANRPTLKVVYSAASVVAGPDAFFGGGARLGYAGPCGAAQAGAVRFDPARGTLNVCGGNGQWGEVEVAFRPITVVLQPDADAGFDAYIQSAGNNGAGTSGSILAGAGGYGGKIRSILKVDLSSIPSDAMVVDAKLELWERVRPGLGTAQNWGNQGKKTFDLTFHKIIVDWDEGTTEGANDGAGWSTRKANGNAAWTEPGCRSDSDRMRQASLRMQIDPRTGGGSGNLAANGFVTFSSPEFIQDIRDFVRGRRTNYGWVMRTTEGENALEGHSEGGGSAIMTYYSSDASGDDAHKRPRWTVSYTLHGDVPASNIGWVQSGQTSSVIATGNSFAPVPGTSNWRAVGNVLLRGDGWIECWLPNYQTNQNREVQLYAPFTRDSYTYAEYPNEVSHVWWVRTGDGCGVYLGEKISEKHGIPGYGTPTRGCGTTSVSDGDVYRLTRTNGIVALTFNGKHIATGYVKYTQPLAVQASIRYEDDRQTCTIGGDWILR